MEGTYTVV